MFFKSEVDLKDGKKMLKVSNNNNFQIILSVAIMVFVFVSIYLMLEVFKIELNSLIVTPFGLLIGAVYVFWYKKEKKNLLAKKKPNTNIIVDEPDKRNSEFWIEID